MKRVLMLTGISWNETFQRHQQFALYLKRRGYQVVFVERIVSSKFSVSKLVRVLKNRKKVYGKSCGNNAEGVILANYHFLNPENGIFKLVNRYKINKLLKEYGTNYDVVINYLPINTTRMIIDKLSCDHLIYDCVRNFEEFGGYRRDIADEEKYIILKSEKVFTDSYFLTDKIKKSKRDVVQFLPIANSDWLKGCLPKQISSITDIAYFGTVRDQDLDVGILKGLSLLGYHVHIWGIVLTEVSFDFINHGFESDLEKLAREISTICDAIILPYRGKIDGIIPAKLVQSLCTKLPVFCTRFYDSMVLKKCLYLFDDMEQLIKIIENFDYNYFYEMKLSYIKDFVEPLNERQQELKFINQLE